MTRLLRPAWAEIDRGALGRAAAVLASVASPARLCAVVKADAYGHGAITVAEAVLAHGADRLAVATVDEGMALREAGVVAPILLLSEPPPEAMADAVAYALTPTVYTAAGVRAVAAAAGPDSAERHAKAGAAARAFAAAAPLPAVAGAHGGSTRRDGSVGVHLKVDTGMHRVGADVAELPAVARAAAVVDGAVVEGLWTHLAKADDPLEVGDPDRGFTAAQLRCFDDARRRLAADGINPPIVHAANSAGAIAHPRARLSMVRCGIALYGYPPVPFAPDGAPASGGGHEITPALSLKARVAHVRRVGAGEGLSYGLLYTTHAPTQVAVIPLGYADGVPRRLSLAGGAVLIGGRRRPLAGVVTMDQLLVDCGPDNDVAVGDEVVLLGRQGGEMVDAEEWARLCGTISYEILCGIGPRVPRLSVG